jgi:hypothetical protein
MRTIDVQVHACEHNHPGRPWSGQLHGPQSANGEEMAAAIDEVVAACAGTKGAAGVRITLRDELPSDPADPRANRAFAAAGRRGFAQAFHAFVASG